MSGSKKSSKKEAYKQWWFWVIIGVVAIIGIGGAIGNKDKQTNTAAPTTTSKKEKEEENPNLFEETEMEAFCQEDHVNDIKGYFSGHKISIIKITDYNKYFNATQGGKTKDTNSDVALLTWKGHDKTLDKDIGFSCYATKINGEKKLLYLAADSNVIRGTLDF